MRLEKLVCELTGEPVRSPVEIVESRLEKFVELENDEKVQAFEVPASEVPSSASEDQTRGRASSPV